MHFLVPPAVPLKAAERCPTCAGPLDPSPYGSRFTLRCYGSACMEARTRAASQRVCHAPRLTERSAMIAVFLLLLASPVWAQKPKAATIVVAPSTVSMPIGGMQFFTATTTGTTKLPVWSATGGAVTQSGRYDAGQVPGIYSVTATLPANVKSTAVIIITSVTDTTAPTVPTNLTVSLLTGTSFDLGWNPSTDAVGVMGYGVYVNGLLVDVAVGAGTSLSGLLCDTTTGIGIDAVDAAGNRSAKALISVATLPCVIPQDTTPPTAPTNLTAVAAQTTIGLNWTASTDGVGVVGYGIYLNGNLRQSTTSTGATITGLTCAQTFTVAVDAVDLAGNRSTKISLFANTLSCTTSTSTTVVFVPPTDYATNVDSCRVEIRRTIDSPSTPALSSQNLGKPTPVNGEISVDISTLVTALPSGDYYAIVVAVNAAAATPSLASLAFTK